MSRRYGQRLGFTTRKPKATPAPAPTPTSPAAGVPAEEFLPATAKMALAYAKIAKAARERGDTEAALKWQKAAQRISERTAGLAKGGTVKKNGRVKTKKGKTDPPVITPGPTPLAKGGTVKKAKPKMHTMPNDHMMPDKAMKKMPAKMARGGILAGDKPKPAPRRKKAPASRKGSASGAWPSKPAFKFNGPRR